MRLNEICAAIVDCEHRTAPEGDGYALSVGTRAMKNGRLVVDACKPVSKDTFIGWSRRMVPVEGDLVLAREAPVGQVIRVPKLPRICLGQRTVLIRPDAARVHPRFLHYWLLGPDAQGPMAAQAAGATVAHLNVEDIRRLDVSKLPQNRRHQRAAAETLGGIDDLIENNRRRVEVLEEMARAIYREWFVHLRYPGHANARFVDTPVGPIPAGWSLTPLAELVSTQYGYTESASNVEVGPRYLRGMDINKRSYIDWSTVPFCPIDDASLAKFRVEVGDVFLIRMADPGKVGICEVATNAVFASYLVRMRPSADRISSYFLFFALSAEEYQSWITGASTGATRKSVSAKVMTEPRIVLPPQQMQEAFEAVVRPLRSLMTSLVRANATLASVRDSLLPRVVSGQIDVSSLDLDTVLETGAV